MVCTSGMPASTTKHQPHDQHAQHTQCQRNPGRLARDRGAEFIPIVTRSQTTCSKTRLNPGDVSGEFVPVHGAVCASTASRS